MLTLIDLNYARQIAPLISEELFAEIRKTLDDQKRVIIYLNRRGEATSLFCKDCGMILRCEFCDISLTLHRYPTSHLLCHQCNTSHPIPETCEKCHGTNLKPIGVGIQKIEESITKLFPQTNIFRFDSDRTRHESTSMKDLDGAEIIIATELGNTLIPERLGLVVFCLFEANLTTPEYDMEERTYTQIAYNIKKRVPVLLQTFTPQARLVQILSDGNYKDFLTHTLAERKAFQYPPYGDLAYIWVEEKNRDRVKDIIHKLVNKLQISISEYNQSQARHAELDSASQRSNHNIGRDPELNSGGQNDITIYFDKELFERRAGKYRQKIVLRGVGIELLLQEIRGEIFRNSQVRVEWK